MRLTRRAPALPVLVLATTVAALLPAPAAPAATDGTRANAAIVGGHQVAVDRSPATVAVLDTTREGTDFDKQVCGGTLIAPTIVLTAGHCVVRPGGGTTVSAADRRVVIGRTDLRRPGGDTFEITAIANHPLYDNDTLFHDVALLKLDRPSAVRPAALADRNFRLRAGQRSTAYGWGLTARGGDASPVLRRVTLPLWSNRRCARIYRAMHEPGLMLCAGGLRGRRDICNGDSGGPLLVRDAAGVQRLVGVTSWNVGCSLRDRPSNFAWAASPHLRGWILRRAAGLAANSSDVAPALVASLRQDGTAVRYSLGEPAEVVFTIQRQIAGRYRSLPTALVHQGRAGENGFRIARTLRGRPIEPGAYRLRAVATDAAGNLSAPAFTDITIP
jgi:secreted trypsin-like serine protease